MTWRIMRRRSPGIVGERQRPTGHLAVRCRFLHPLVDVAAAMWTQAPTGHLFNYPKKLIGDAEGRWGYCPESLASPIASQVVQHRF
ncbi:hypothetical protein ACVJF2_000136 [Bradyrhizobium sp. USDA 4519]